jgi:hypothetical protein
MPSFGAVCHLVRIFGLVLILSAFGAFGAVLSAFGSILSLVSFRSFRSRVRRNRYRCIIVSAGKTRSDTNVFILGVGTES